MVKVSKNSHHTKYRKQELIDEGTEKYAVVHHSKLQKKKENKLTNARITISHLQNGYFMKGKSSQKCHRKEDAKLNSLNKARMNEKLSEILNLANNVGKSKEKSIYDGTDTYKDKVSLPYRNVNLENKTPSCSSPSIITNERLKFTQIPRSFYEKKRICKDQIENEQIIFNGQSVTSETNCENVSDNKHKEFKSFLTFFDNAVALQNVFIEDFIASEKLDLKQKKRLCFRSRSSEDILIKQLSNRKSEDINLQSRNSNGERKKEDNGITSDKRIFQRISKPKYNPNYVAFKNSKQDPVVKTMYGQIKKQKELKNNNTFYQYLLPEESHERSKLNDKMFTSHTENVFQNNNKYEQNSILLNPMSFLAHSLPGDSSKKHTKDTSPFKFLSQPCTSNYKDEKKVNEKFEIPVYPKHSPSKHNFIESHLKHTSTNIPIQESNIFELMFERGDEEYCHLNDHPNANKFSSNDFSLNDINSSENHLNSSQPRRSNDVFSFLEGTNTCRMINSIYSPININIPPLQNPMTKSSSPYYVLENTSNQPQYSFQTTHHKSKIEISPVSDTQDVDVRESNFWYRRKMF